MPWKLLLIVIAVVLAILAAVPVPSRVHLGWLSLAAFELSFLVP